MALFRKLELCCCLAPDFWFSARPETRKPRNTVKFAVVLKQPDLAAGRLLGFLGRSGRQQQPQAEAAPATPTPGDSTPQQRDTPVNADESMLEPPLSAKPAAAHAGALPETQLSSTAGTTEAPHTSSTQAAITRPTTDVTAPASDAATPQGHVTASEADADASDSRHTATPQAPLQPSLGSSLGQQAATATGDSPDVVDASALSGEPGTSPHPPEEPTLQSSQDAAQQTSPKGSHVHEQAAEPDAATQQPQSASGEGGGGSEGMDGAQWSRRGSGEQAGVPAMPQELALQSGAARHAASMQNGRSSCF